LHAILALIVWIWRRYTMPIPTERGPLGDLSGETASLVAILISALVVFVLTLACVALLPA
jgi:hypothetical protein